MPPLPPLPPLGGGCCVPGIGCTQVEPVRQTTLSFSFEPFWYVTSTTLLTGTDMGPCVVRYIPTNPSPAAMRSSDIEFVLIPCAAGT